MIFHKRKKVPNLSIALNNIAITKVDTFNYLGILLDSNLSWKSHTPTKHDVKDIIKTFEDYLQVLQTKTSRHQNVNNLEIIYCLRFA